MDFAMAAEAAQSSGGDGYWQLAMMVAAIGLLGLFARYRRARLAANPPPNAKEIRERAADPDRYRSASDQALAALLETASQLTAEVNTKARVLNSLIKQAEEKSARLEELLERAENAVANGHPEAVASGAPGAAPENAAAGSGRLATVATEQAFPSGLHERISLLAAEGKTVAEIAKATNLSIIEVRFALKSMGN